MLKKRNVPVFGQSIWTSLLKYILLKYRHSFCARTLESEVLYDN